MSNTRTTTLCRYGLLATAAAISFTFPRTLTVPATVAAAAAAPPEQIHLTGPVRDFRKSHPDFGITTSSVAGHYAWNVGPVLSPRNRPLFGGGGLRVLSDWLDQDGHPIAPYATDPGLPGGHFDVDVYDVEGSTKPKQHTHQFDDKYDLSYVDLVHDVNLLFDSMVGAGYPNNVRVEFANCQNGVGFYSFDGGSGLQVGTTLDGFTATFAPAALTQLRVDFVSLHGLRATAPSAVKSDPVNRDDSFRVRMYDTVTSEMIYELCVYHHGDGIPDPGSAGASGNDACGNPFSDTAGMFGSMGDGAVTSTETFDQWFTDRLGTNISRPLTITLVRDPMGVYEYLTDDFYPIDNDLFGNEGQPHNQYFTYMFTASFVYETCADQFFEFEGNDDCWVYVDRKRVIDLGGVETPSKQYVAMDRLGLVNGETYTLAFFFAYRADAFDSVFRMRTTLPLYSTTSTLATGGYD